MANQPFKTVVVEDEPLIRRNLVKKVEASHPHFHVVHEAMNGQEALDFIDSEITDLVITDIKMPEMNGLELAQNLYFAYPHIKMVIVSGHDEFEYAQQAIKYEVEDYLLKPVTKENLTSVLNRIELKLNADMDSLAQMATSLSEGIPPQEIVDTIKSFIKKNYQKKISLQEIANQLNYSIDYIGKLFKKHTGETPIKYITRVRINEAKRILIQDPEMDIKTIGKVVGYPDPHYFSRVFKNNIGCYPKEYRTRAYETSSNH